MYFKCKKPKHMAKDCYGPTNSKLTMNVVKAAKPTTIERVFAMNGAKDSRSKNLVLGECIIVNNLLFVLYDLGATHSFILYDCVNRLSLPTRILSFDLLVSTPIATLVTCPIVVHGCNYNENLICLLLSSLDTLIFPSLEDIGFITTNQDFVEVARDFPKVFLEEVLDLPPQCEVEFAIY
ncbi:hypothetical protein CR513_51723, partial [Mucuna pruriens]